MARGLVTVLARHLTHDRHLGQGPSDWGWSGLTYQIFKKPWFREMVGWHSEPPPPPAPHFASPSTPPGVQRSPSPL